MLSLPRTAARSLPVVAAAAAALTATAPAEAASKRLPVYEVKSAGASEEQAARLAEAFGLNARLRGEDGSLSFLDADRFGFLPVMELPTPAADEEGREVVAEAPDLDAIRAIKPLSGDVALDLAVRGLKEAGLSFSGAGKITHSHFDSVDEAGRKTVSADIDTHVSFPAKLNGLPLIGPGSKSKLVFDPDGNLTYLRFAQRELSEAGTVPVLSSLRADRLVKSRLAQTCPGQAPITNLKLTRRLVYSAPSLERGTVQQILPHYDYGATATVNGTTVRLQRVLVPAVKGGLSAKLSAEAVGPRVSASTSVAGGTAPYTYRYGSCATTLPERAAAAGEQTAYSIRPREGGSSTVSEQVSVTVTDANGLTATASAPVAVTAGIAAKRAPKRARASIGGRVDVATEWIGNTQGLPNSSANAADLRDEMSDVSTIAFNWGDNNVFQSDFVDPALGGDDSNWADNVDLMWFQGHGNPNGFATGASQGDGWVDRSEARWGNTDLEWLVVNSCSVLELGSGATNVWNRWSPAFRGLHLMLGHGNTSYNVNGDGNEFGDNLADDDMRIRSAWADATEGEQPDGVIYRYMGVYGPSGEWNRNDYFHGIGSVSADITSVTGAWSYSGTV